MRVSTFALAAAIAAIAADASAYTIRPRLFIGGAVDQDGLELNGATQKSLTNTVDQQAHVDLDDGTIKLLATAPAAGTSRQSAGLLHDRVTFENATGTIVDFSFDYDGTIDVSQLLPGPLATGYSAVVFGNLFVYDANAGANHDNFSSLGGALVAKSMIVNYGTGSGATPTQTHFDVLENLSGSFEVTGQTAFDVFMSLSIAGVTNTNAISIVMDFLDTGTGGIGTEAGVTYTSESGVFLSSTGQTASPVPIPAALPLFATGLAGLGFAHWRRRRRA